MKSTPDPAGALPARDQRVFDAVRELLARQGMQLSMDAVAQRAGCSKQTLYSRYGNKESLLRQVVQRMYAAPPPACAALVTAMFAAACCSLRSIIWTTSTSLTSHRPAG